MGSGHLLQLDGIGGGSAVTSKVAIVGPSTERDVDVDYTFAQVGILTETVDMGPTCGNLLAGVGPFAIEMGMVKATPGQTVVRIRAANTGALVTATLQTPGGDVCYDGDILLDGVTRRAAPVHLSFEALNGSKTGSMFPTGARSDIVDGIAVTCMDVAVPMVFARAEVFGKTGYEAAATYNADSALLARLERIRQECSLLMGLGDATHRVIPKMALLASGRYTAGISSRYFVPDRCHPSHAVTGAIAVGACTLTSGTVGSQLLAAPRGSEIELPIEHPSGVLMVSFTLTGTSDDIRIKKAAVVRTVRKIMTGHVFA
jgi:2-methylaconitate cis-trans-isomerase PrpF